MYLLSKQARKNASLSSRHQYDSKSSSLSELKLHVLGEACVVQQGLHSLVHGRRPTSQYHYLRVRQGEMLVHNIL